MILSHSSVIDISLLPSEVRKTQPDAAIDDGLEASVTAVEKNLIRNALEEAGGIQTKAAEKLKISERVLRYKLAKYKFK